MSVAVNLTCQDEWIGQGSPQEFLQFERTGLCAFMIEKSQDSSSQVYGLPDDFFIRGRVPMTKEEVRAVSVAKLHLNPDALYMRLRRDRLGQYRVCDTPDKG